ncbi:hypothetical protein BV20DRAFT_1111046 [Pilatotrama ljubarskyi]|nr:hypothetical protein BV20DRAFT_1111046 [Pilatotrama ljubarskyi]
MTLGPPPSAAGPSGSAPAAQAAGGVAQTAPSAQHATPAADTSSAAAPGPSVSTGPYTSQFSVQPQPASRPYYAQPGPSAYPASYSANPSYSGAPQQTAQHHTAGRYPAHTSYYSQQPQTQGASQGQTGTYSYYNYPQNAWANTWNTGAYQYGPGGGFSYSYAQSAPQQPPPQATQTAPPQQTEQPPAIPTKRKPPTPTPSPSPSPPPEYHKDWDAIIKSFLSTIGFSQTLRGFEADMLVLNPDHERKKVPAALGELMKDLLKLGQVKPEEGENQAQERPLEERKLDYVHLANGAQPRSQTSITRDISRFLAQNRARNDASNRNEFLLSLAEKRRRLNENGDSASSEPLVSCARTDAKTQNRDLQMKYDIAKNEDGPLRRTLKSGAAVASTSKAAADSAATSVQDYPSAERYPALGERLQNVEKHLSIRYVPSPPRSLLDRLKYLEDHIIHLEKEYPPWAALHFNQPNRGWPPPPRPTPIIVPSHLTSSNVQNSAQPATSGTPGASSSANTGQATPVTSTEATDGVAKKGKQGRTAKSSLHRAVMERLEVQKAIQDLTGGDGG